jgi:hypothetical protein
MMRRERNGQNLRLPSKGSILEESDRVSFVKVDQGLNSRPVTSLLMSPVLLVLITLVRPNEVTPPVPAIAEFTGQTYGSRQVLTATTIFRGCTFRRCETTLMKQPDYFGGALYLDDATLGLTIAGCLFESCRGMHSGAIGGSCISLCLNETTGLECAAGVGGFCFVRVSSTTTGSLEVRESSTAFCTCGAGTLLLICDSYSDGSTSYIESLNSSANNGSSCASGLVIGQQFNLSFQFCTFAGNTPANCVHFADGTINSVVSCLAFFNNSCKSEAGCPGLICAALSLMLANSILQANTVDYFVGTDADGPVSITFKNCLFDVTALNATNSVGLATEDCQYAPSAEWQMHPGRCPWPAATPPHDEI